MTEGSTLTPERLADLRRIAEAATPGPWWVDGWEVRTKDGDHFIASIAPAFQGDRPDASCWELDANIRHIATFDPPTVLALLDEIERLRWEREVLAEAVRGYEIARETLLDLFGDSFVREGIRTAFSLVGSIREAALALLDGEKGGDGE